MDLSSMLNGSTPSRSAPPPPVTPTPPPSQPSRQNSYSAAPQMTQSTTSNNYQTTSRDKTPLYQLGASLHLAVQRESNTTTPPPPAANHQQAQQQQQPRFVNGLLNSSFRPNASNNGPDRSPSATSQSARSGVMVLGPMMCQNANLWKPKLSLNLVNKDVNLRPSPAKRQRLNPSDESNSSSNSSNNNNNEVQLKTHEVFYRNDLEPKVLLEDKYEIQGAYPRGFFVIMAKRSIAHNFVFSYPENSWFEDLYGLRKSAYFHMRTVDGELYELHLKPSRDKMWLFGYLIKQVDMIRIVKESMNEIIFNRKLPLVLDLDDTLVRLVGEGSPRFVPEADLPQCQDRVAVLNDNRRVVLTERVHEFLEWAQNLYDISICSLGDQSYVENVVNVLDPQRNWVRGILYSARSEHDYIKRSPDPGRPPKDLLALYSFCALKDKSFGSSFSLPLILDDETRMWPTEQHDNIIEVISKVNTPVWSVSLFPVVKDTLQHVHTEFFRQFDNWHNKFMEAEQNGHVYTKEPPSATNVYKTYLRHMLRDMIARGGVGGAIQPTNKQPNVSTTSSNTVVNGTSSNTSNNQPPSRPLNGEL